MDPSFASMVMDRVAAARERVARAGGNGVEIIAVTKGFGPEAIRAAVQAGLVRIGENYAQELVPKVEAARAAGLEFECHFIGHLQTNKVRSLVRAVDVWQTADRSPVLHELAKRAGSGTRLLLQVNSTGEDAKAGCAPGDVGRLVDEARSLGLQVEGLMTMGPSDEDPGLARAAFRATRALVDRLGLVECSMGMSGDLEIAVEEGATLVRIGRALFGDRPARQ